MDGKDETMASQHNELSACHAQALELVVVVHSRPPGKAGAYRLGGLNVHSPAKRQTTADGRSVIPLKAVGHKNVFGMR